MSVFSSMEKCIKHIYHLKNVNMLSGMLRHINNEKCVFMGMFLCDSSS